MFVIKHNSCKKLNKSIVSHNSDFSDRDGLVKSLRVEYGEENVYPIVNFNTLQIKSLVKDVSKLYGVPFEEVNDVTKKLDDEVRPKAMGAGENKSLFMLKYEDCVEHSPDFAAFMEKYPQVAQHIKVLYRQLRTIGKHAGGVIVTQNAQEAMPLIASQGEMRTPWSEGMNRKDLEVYGLVKFDLLGLETLRIFENCISLILQRKHGIKNPTWEQIGDWYQKNLDVEVLDTNDQRVYENVFANARFAGIFQFTAKHTQKFIQKFDPKSIDDLAVATSIYRPGPLAAHVDKLYIGKKQRAAAGEKFEYDHPAIEKVLGSTFGYPVFQEQLMSLAAELSGMNPDECDKLRKTILKRSVQSQAGQKTEVAILEEKFVEGAVKNGLARDKAQKQFEDLAAFASYGFNRSHAIAYSLESYQCAWLCTYFEPEWLCAYVETMIGNSEERETAISELKSFGYEIGKVDINVSGHSWTIDDEKKMLMPSFKTVKGIGEAAIDEIIENRPYGDIESLLWNEDGTWKHSKFNKRALESLTKIEAFDSMDVVGKGKIFENYRHMHMVLVEYQDMLKKKNGKENFVELLTQYAAPDDWSAREKLEFQKELIGDIRADSLLPAILKEKLKEKCVPSVDEIEEDETRVAWFVPTSADLRTSKNGKQYFVLSVLGSTGIPKRVMCWGTKNGNSINIGIPYLGEVKKDSYGLSTTYWKLREISVALER